jgi:hypothetical protein
VYFYFTDDGRKITHTRYQDVDNPAPVVDAFGKTSFHYEIRQYDEIITEKNGDEIKRWSVDAFYSGDKTTRPFITIDGSELTQKTLTRGNVKNQQAPPPPGLPLPSRYCLDIDVDTMFWSMFHPFAEFANLRSSFQTRTEIQLANGQDLVFYIPKGSVAFDFDTRDNDYNGGFTLKLKGEDYAHPEANIDQSFSGDLCDDYNTVFCPAVKQRHYFVFGWRPSDFVDLAGNWASSLDIYPFPAWDDDYLRNFLP